MNLNRAVKLVARLDAAVERVRRTGELRLSHPAMERPCRVNRRRKDSPRQLPGWLRKLERALA